MVTIRQNASRFAGSAIHGQRRARAILLATALASSLALIQTSYANEQPTDTETGIASGVPANKNGRYTLTRTDDGYLRMDTRTGAMSLCKSTPARSDQGTSSAGSTGTTAPETWRCEAVRDDRLAYQREVERLATENSELRQQLDRLSGFSDDGTPSAGGSGALRLPSEQEVDKVLSFFERTLRKFRRVLESLNTPGDDQSSL